MSTSPSQLEHHCAAIVEGCGQGIQWVAETRKTAPRLDRDADGLTERLRRSRNLARRLGAAAARPMSVGFFGLSQAGKSYLISALARSEAGTLEMMAGDTRLNFIAHVNPPGGGKEATALVTRFTRTRKAAPAGFPIELSLFAEADLVKILGNSFFNDFDSQRVQFRAEPDFIRTHLGELAKRRQAGATGGIAEDDVIDIMDYFVRRFPLSMEPLLGDYWPSAVDLAPYLKPADRALLFSVLWGGVEDLTSTFLLLRGGLEKVGHARIVHAPLSALVKESGGGLSQSDNIMNVDILERMGRDDSDVVALIPQGPDGLLAETGLPRSLLAALAMEMRFELADKPVEHMIETTDLLDFPGYRGRMKIKDLAEAREKLEGRDPVAGLILRGKVAYLFERYTDEQEMNVLVLCTPCHKQSDINDVGEVLTGWINSTQGASPEERARRRAGLLWAITMFDIRLSPRPDETKDLMSSGWNGMMRLSLLERFEQFEWLSDWNPGKAFDNLFLVRKPGMATAVIETEGNREISILQSQRQRIADLRETFVAETSVRRHVADPEAAWDAMMALDDGGMSRLARALTEVARPESKLERIGEIVGSLRRDLLEVQLGAYYRKDGADAVAQKKLIVDRVINAVRGRPTTFGELLHMLIPSADHMRALYVRAETAASDTPEPAATPVPADGGLISLDGFFGGGAAPASATQAVAKPRRGGRADAYAKAVISHWMKQLRQLPDRLEIHRLLGFSADDLRAVTDEIITAALRQRIEESLAEALHDGEVMAGTTRVRLADRQVRIAERLIGDFVDQLGLADRALADRPASSVQGRPAVFAPPPPLDGLPRLTPQPVNYSGLYILDWLDAFSALAVDNAGHAAGSEITPDQNERLGRVLSTIGGV